MFKVSLTQNDIDYRIFSDICSLKINMDKLSAYVIWKCMLVVLILSHTSFVKIVKPPTSRNCIMWFKLPSQNFPIVLEIASSSTLKLNDKSNTFSWLAKTEMVYNRLISATAGIIKVCRFGTCNIKTLLINSFSWVYLQIEQLQSFADFSKSSPVAS